MNIITRFDDGKKDRPLFVLLQDSGKIIRGEINLVIIFPKKLKLFEKRPELLSTLAEGVINNLPRKPQPGVTFVRDIKGIAINSINPGTEADRWDASIRISARVSSFFEF